MRRRCPESHIVGRLSSQDGQQEADVGDGQSERLDPCHLLLVRERRHAAPKSLKRAIHAQHPVPFAHVRRLALFARDDALPLPVAQRQSERDVGVARFRPADDGDGVGDGVRRRRRSAVGRQASVVARELWLDAVCVATVRNIIGHVTRTIHERNTIVQ